MASVMDFQMKRLNKEPNAIERASRRACMMYQGGAHDPPIWLTTSNCIPLVIASQKQQHPTTTHIIDPQRMLTGVLQSFKA
jgi:hypothetical protein